MYSKAKKLWKIWDQFWFGAECVKKMNAFRTLFALILFCAFAMRTQDLTLFYTDKGILPLSVVPEISSPHYRFSLLQYFTGEVSLWVFHVSLLASLLALAMNFYPRFFSLVSLVLHVSFIHRNIGVSYGLDSLASYYLFYLCFADSGKVKKNSPVGSMAYRLGQIQLCIIYAFSGAEKLRGASWWKGEAIWDVLNNYLMARWDFSWLSTFAIPLIFLTYATLIWEIYFPILVWTKKMRRPVLLMGVIVHLGIGITLNLLFFELATLSVYVLFLEQQELVALQRWMANRFQVAKMKNFYSKLKSF